MIIKVDIFKHFPVFFSTNLQLGVDPKEDM